MNKKLCYMDINNFIIAYIKADDVYKVDLILQLWMR